MKRDLYKLFFVFILFAEQAYSQNINRHNIEGPAGLQVNSYSGSLFYQRTDLEIPGRGLSINLTFSYNSATTSIDYGYGPGWMMAYSMLCKRDSNKVIIHHPDGRMDKFTAIGNHYNAPAGIFDSLVQYQAGKFKLFSTAGIIFYFDDSVHHRLTKMSDMNNNSIIIGYNDSLASTITDASGRIVTLSYTNGHLTQITDLNFVPVRTISYLYDSDNNPITVTDPLGNSIHYEYDALHNMEKVLDQLSSPFSINYKNCMNVMSITSPLNLINLSYDNTSLTTTVTEMVNNVQQSSTYRYNSNGDLVEKTGSWCGYHQLFAYDASHNLVQRTDANGNIYNYTYDSKGNPLQETDPQGSNFVCTVVGGFAADPVWFTLSGKTDRNGNTTAYSYDANANLLQVSKPLGINESFSYDISGNIISYTDGRGNITNYQYNVNGDLTLVTYAGGAANSYSYDNAGNRTSYTDANGNTTSYTFDKLNRLTQLIDALGNTTVFAYDARSSLISSTNTLGHVTAYIYDALVRVTSVTDPAGTISAVYDEKGNTLSVTDRRGIVMNYTYDVRNLLITETDPFGFIVTYNYDANGNKTSAINRRGFSTSYTYDSRDYLTGVTDALSNIAAYSYDANGNVISYTDVNGHITAYGYDALNRQIQTHRPIGMENYSYDAANNQTTTTDANGHTTTYSYDNRNRQIAAADALGHSSVFSYDLQGNLISNTDRLGHTTTFTYDARNRNLTLTNPLGETEVNVYDAVGRITSVISPTGNTITYTYDTANRIIAATDLSGSIAAYTYDGNSNLINETNANGQTTSYVYDLLNRVIGSNDPMGNTSTYGYNPEGTNNTFTDRNGNTTNYRIDALERIIVVEYPSGISISTDYDPAGNIISMTDNNGSVTAYVYDANDRLITETSAGGSTKNYTYDAAGNNISRADNNSNTSNYVYDALNRLTLRNFPGTNDDNYVYDNEGRITAATNVNASLSFTYDNADRMLSESLNGKTTSYTYDITNRKVTIAYPGGRSIEENYDLRLRLQNIKEGVNILSGYTYDAADRILNRTYLNGVVSNYFYNNNDQVTSLNHVKLLSIQSQFNYGLDNEDNIISVQKNHHPANSEKYTFDNDYRLTNYKEGTLSGGSIPAPVTQTQYNYDGVGNRTTKVLDTLTTTYTTNNLNQYTSVSEGVNISLVYDLNGSLLNDGSHSYSYDFENRLISVDAGVTANYKYDPFGRRIQKNNLSGTINYYFRNQQVIEERNVSDSVQATYIYGTWVDDILSMRRAGTDYFYQQNSLGSVVSVTDIMGAVVERYEYDAYGKPSFYNGLYIPMNSTGINNRILFTGREYDSETGNYDYRARSYNPKLGRFTQRDPIGNWKDIMNQGNHYGYVGSSPVNWIDPSGLINLGAPVNMPEKVPVKAPQIGTPAPAPSKPGAIADALKKTQADDAAKSAVIGGGSQKGNAGPNASDLKRKHDLEEKLRRIKEEQERLEKERKKLEAELKNDGPPSNKGQVGPPPVPKGVIPTGPVKVETKGEGKTESPKTPVTSNGPKPPEKKQPPKNPPGSIGHRGDSSIGQPAPVEGPQKVGAPPDIGKPRTGVGPCVGGALKKAVGEK